MAKQMGSETIEYIETRLEGKFQLEINREKTRAQVPECVSVEEGGPTGAGEVARNDEQSSVFQADTEPDWRVESTLEGVGELFLQRVPAQRLLRDRWLCSGPTDSAFAASQPEAVPASRRGVLVRALETVGAVPSFGACASLRRELSGERDAGNLHLRFDEGRVGRGVPVTLSPTLPARHFRSCYGAVTARARISPGERSLAD